MRVFHHKKVAAVFMRRSSDATPCLRGQPQRAAGILCILLLSALGAAWADTNTVPDNSAARKKIALLLKLERLEADEGVYSPSAITHLMELSQIYLGEDDCPQALFMLNRAVNLTRINYGLFNSDQMEFGEPMKECYLELGLPYDFEREQRYTITLSDNLYGKNDPRALPTLQRVALWYEEAGWYLSARSLYIRAADVARRAGGNMDLRMVEPLRGIARTRRLAYVRGLENTDIEVNGGSSRITDLQWRRSVRVLDRLGEESLKQAISILRTQSQNERAELIDTLLDLGDWYQIGDTWRNALGTYKEVMREYSALGETKSLFEEPIPVIYHMEDIGVKLRHPLPNPERYDLYWVKFDFTVTSKGQVIGLKVIDSDAPDTYRSSITESFLRTRYRPRFAQGDPVDTEHVRFRQGLYVKK
jgi:hypothetical protein